MIFGTFLLGHPSHVKIQIIHNELHIPNSLSHLSSHCKICHMAKQKCLPFVSHNNVSANPFDIVHIDIWGPFNVSTPVGHRYFLTIVDDCTRATWVYLLCAKADVLTVFPESFNLISTQYNTVIKSLRSNNAPELAFHDLFRTKIVIPYHSCVAILEQNSVVKHKHQHILNVA